MKYITGSAFRKALEHRLLQRSRTEAIPLTRLRKAYAFDRLLARLFALQPDEWVLKGGYALQVRFALHARVTKDIDLALAQTENIHIKLTTAAALDLEDWTEYVIAPPSGPANKDENAIRFRVLSMVDSRRFESFNLDIGLHDPKSMPAEAIVLPDTLGFAELPPVTVQLCSLEQQIAEKFHAFTQICASGYSTRVKDLADIILIAESDQNLRADNLRTALCTTFELRNRTLPDATPDAPSDWARPYAHLAQEINIIPGTLIEAMEVVRTFLNPILAGQTTGIWRAGRWLMPGSR